MKRLLMVLALAGFAVACGDDDDDDVTPANDGGAKDSGPGTDGGPKDAGSGMDAGPAVSCGGMVCTPFMHPTLGLYAAGCAKNAAGADVCGVSTDKVGGADAGYPSFVEKEAPGVFSASCGAFFDSMEQEDDMPDGGPKGNGKIDTVVNFPGIGMIAINYPGCCTAKGFCSVDTKMTSAAGAAPSNGGFGCLESTIAFRTLPAAAQMIACDKATGMIGGGSDAGTNNVTDAGGIDAGT